MKENSVLHVLMYLFQNHMQNDCEVDTVDIDLVGQLESAGFILPVINQAIGWLANLSSDNDTDEIEAPKETSFRVFSDYELEILGDECINFVTELEEQGILNTVTREIVIHQAIELCTDGMDINLIKWVTLMVLFNQPDETEALSCMELLVLEHPFGGLH
jgi:Smg protein